MNTSMRSRYRLADKAVWRVGYGAMQLAGDGVFGPPRDHDEAIAVQRSAVDAGVDHIDTAQYYGPGVVNELIRGDVYFWGTLMAGALLGSIPVAIVYSFFVENYVSGLTAGAEQARYPPYALALRPLVDRG